MLIVDVRGNRRSGRLGCPTLDTAQWIADGQQQVDAVARCAQEVGPRRDDYTTVSSVLDVEAIRRALNLPRPSLFGASYGTWVVQTYAALFPELVQAAVIDGIVPFDLDPWGRTYTEAMQRVLRLRCERTELCDPDEADVQVRRVAANLAAQPVPFPNSTRLLTEGAFSGVCGLITTLSGPAGYLGQDIRDGFQLAVDMQGGPFEGASRNPCRGRWRQARSGQADRRSLSQDQQCEDLTGIVFGNVAAAVVPDVLEADAVYVSTNTAFGGLRRQGVPQELLRRVLAE